MNVGVTQRIRQLKFSEQLMIYKNYKSNYGDYSKGFQCKLCNQNMFKLKSVVHYFLDKLHNVQVLYMQKRLTVNGVLKAFLKNRDS
jgi:hypothetical protein